MLKRKFYWVAMGIVASHLSIANLIEPRSFGRGDCADCGASKPVEFPLASNTKLDSIVANIQGNLGKGITGFTHGNSVNGAFHAQKTADMVNKAAAAYKPETPAPFVVPGAMRLVPTQSEYERLMPATWLDAIRAKTYYDPFSGPQQIVPTNAGYFNGALPYWGNPFTLYL